MSARRLLIVLMNTDPRNSEELGAPFYYAAVAAAMDHPVDVLCTAAAGKLMLKGIAEAIHVKPGDPMTVYDWIKEAHGQGAKFWACPANLELLRWLQMLGVLRRSRCPCTVRRISSISSGDRCSSPTNRFFAVLTRMSSSSLACRAVLSRFCDVWIRNTIRNVMTLVSVFITNCQVSEN
jgi:uncharacterized protein